MSKFHTLISIDNKIEFIRILVAQNAAYEVAPNIRMIGVASSAMEVFEIDTLRLRSGLEVILMFKTKCK
uniref:Uncharacterized protein n=1 Tax=Acrobeloides nanus TaxID=290746 RepID=A0A914DJT1_9BILA